MENTKYGKRREGRWTPIREKAQDTRDNPNSWETHLVRKRCDIGLLRALSLRIMVMSRQTRDGVVSTLGCPWYFRYNFSMAWPTRTIYTSKCAQLDPLQLPEMSKFYSICSKCVMQRSLVGRYPLTSPRV